MTNTKSSAEHVFISYLREFPAADVALVVDGKTICGTNPLQLTASIDEMIREAKEAAWEEGAEAEAETWCDTAIPCGTCSLCTSPGPTNPYAVKA